MTWTKVIDLVRWADNASARFEFPKLVRRLVQRAAPKSNRIDFPCDEQVFRPGPDGVVETLERTRYVPYGVSFWQLGTGVDPAAKAKEDYSVITSQISIEERSKSVFVFATPRVWVKSREWALDTRKRAEWRDVFAYDANDIEHWLDLLPTVDLWFARLIGKPLEDVIHMEQYWESLKSIAEVRLKPELFLASRDEEIALLEGWLAQAPRSIFLQTESAMDGVDFVAALSQLQDHSKFSNSLLIKSEKGWNSIIPSSEPSILVAAPSLLLRSTDIEYACAHGHHAITTGLNGSHDVLTCRIRKQDFYDVERALLACRFSVSKAKQIARAFGGSTSILKRLISRFPDSTLPLWARDEHRAKLAPFALIGSWVGVSRRSLQDGFTEQYLDTDVVQELVQVSRNELESLVLRWSRCDDPLFTTIENTVYVSSREDAWYFLGGYLLESQKEKFQELALLILEEEDPAFELPVNSRWHAPLGGKSHALSKEIRTGVLESLAIMSTLPTSVDQNAPLTPQVTRRIVDEILPVGVKWQRWASIGSNLPLLAEAAPDEFLKKVSIDLRRTSPQLRFLFQDQSSSAFSEVVHSGLLWALETLSWTPKYLSQSTLALIQLSELDPGGIYTNRPFNSLVEIYLPWMCHTTASVEERIAILSHASRSHPEIVWKLALHLLPGNYPHTSFETNTPRFRRWMDGWNRNPSRGETYVYFRALANLALSLAGKSLERLSLLLRPTIELGDSYLERFLNQSEASVVDLRFGNDQYKLWESLDGLLSDSTQFAGLLSLLDPKSIDRIQQLHKRIEPKDPIQKGKRFFYADTVQIKVESDLQSKRIEALNSIFSKYGRLGFQKLANEDAIRERASIGFLVGTSMTLGESDLCLPSGLYSADQKWREFLHGYIQGRFQKLGVCLFDEVGHSSDWSPTDIGTFALALPFTKAVWRWVGNFGAESEKAYWSRCYGFALREDREELEYAVGKLQKSGNPDLAVRNVYFAIKDGVTLESTFVLDFLDAILPAWSEKSHEDRSKLAVAILGLIEFLQNMLSDSSMRLAQIEWQCFSLFERSQSNIQPKAILREFMQSSMFFNDVVAECYQKLNTRLRDEGKERAYERQQSVRQFVRRIHSLPGLHADGTFSFQYFSDWVHRIRLTAVQRLQRDETDEVLGRIIAQSWFRISESQELPKLCCLLTQLNSPAIFAGFRNAFLSAESSQWIDSESGRRELISTYNRMSDVVASLCFPIAIVFRELSEFYSEQLRKDDQEMEKKRLGRD